MVSYGVSWNVMIQSLSFENLVMHHHKHLCSFTLLRNGIVVFNVSNF